MLAGAFDQFFHPELFGPLVRLIEILRVAAEAGSRPQFAPAADFIRGAAKLLGIDEGLDQRDGMAPAGEPVVGQAREHLFEQAAGQVGIVRVGQDNEARIVDHQRQAAAALLGGPADELIAVAQVVGRGAEGDQREPLALVGGGIAQVFADERGVAQVVMLEDESVAARELVGRAQQAELEVLEHELFARAGAAKLSFGFCHRRNPSKSRAQSPV